MKKNFLLFILVAFSVVGCNDFLDINPTDKASDKLVWANAEYAQQAVNNFYRYVGNLCSFEDGQSSAGMTEAFTDQLKYGSYNYNAKCFIPSEIAYGGPVLTANYVNVYLGSWNKIYGMIKNVNEGLSNLHKYSNFSEKEMSSLEGQMRFFRAFLYFNLVKKYHSVIIYDEKLQEIKKDKALNTEKEAWDFIAQDLKYAGEKLNNDKVASGIVTSGAAYALLSRAMLYAERWDEARIAAEKVMKIGYELEKDYSKAFALNSKEAIFQYGYKVGSKVTHNFDAYMAPGGDAKFDGNKLVGGFGTPTQEMVESYELADGSGFPNWEKWHVLNVKIKEVPPYEKLEPRFKATILYNGCNWKGRKIETFVNGKDGFAVWKIDAKPEGRTTTGYYLKKLVDEKHSFKTVAESSTPWTELRYAEVLLNHAEACYHDNKYDEANKDIELIRKRVGLPYDNKTGEELLKTIMHERKVELAYEGQYYWDMRRWRLAETAFSGIKLHGIKVEQEPNGSFSYTYIECDDVDRSFPAKLYQLPLPVKEIDNNGLIKQFSEWN